METNKTFKKDFKEWLINDSSYKAKMVLGELSININSFLCRFDTIPIMMQNIIFVEFFASRDIFISVICHEDSNGDFNYKQEIIGFHGNIYDNCVYTEKQNAYFFAIKTAVNLINV